MWSLRVTAGIFTILLCCLQLPDVAEGVISLHLRNTRIPTNGGGSVLITDIGPSNSDALHCQTTRTDPSTTTNWYYKYGEVHQRRVQSDDSVLGWRRNRGRNPYVVRLRSRAASSGVIGQSKEGVYTCEIVGDGVVSVGLYYPIDIEINFRLDPDIIDLSYTVTCTSTGGTVLTSSFTGPGGVAYPELRAEGSVQSSGRDTYTTSVTFTTGRHGDTYNCTASNGASTATTNYTLSSALAPSNITWSQLARSVIRISWVQPEGGAPVRSYTIAVLYGDGVLVAYMTLKSRSRKTIIQRLVDDGREYRVHVVAMSDHLPVTSSLNVSLSKLTSPDLSFVNITTTSFTIILSPSPSLSSSSVVPDHYEINLTRVGVAPAGCHGDSITRNISVDPQQSIVIVTGLEEGSMYEMTVQAISLDFGDSVISTPYYCNTTSGAPSEAPHNLQVTEVTSSSVRLRWQPLTQCLNINGQPQGWQIQYWETENEAGPVSNLSVAGDPMEPGSAEVTALTPDTNCTFQVALVTEDNLVGEFSTSVTTTTLPLAYGPVVSLTGSLRSSSIICVSWQPPYPSNSGITSYQVVYWLRENREDSEKRERVAGNVTEFCFPVPEDVGEREVVEVEVTGVGSEGNGRSNSVVVAVTTTPQDVEGSGNVMLNLVCIQIQFGPTDHCILWSDKKAESVEEELQVAMGNHTKTECPSCDELIFQGRGLFICHDNPHMPTYRVCLSDNNTPLATYYLQQWVETSPAIRVGWLLVRINPLPPLVITSLTAAENPAAMVPTNQTAVSLPTSTLDMIDTCITELQSLCINDTMTSS